MGKQTGKTHRKILDMAMAALMVPAMSYQATGNLFHELAGVLLLLLFLCHNLLNRRWYRALPKGRYSGCRRMLTAVNLLALVSMLAAMGTGIYLSQDIFAPLWGMREAYLVRPFHVAAGAWGTILVSVHSGMHIRQPFLEQTEKEAGKSRILGAVFSIVLAAAGIWAFLALDMPNRLLFRDTGMYWRYPGILLFCANAVLMAFFVLLGALAAAGLRKGQENRKQKKER